MPRFSYISRLVLLCSFCVNVAQAGEFGPMQWFQIKFCQNIRHLSFLPAPEGQLWARGFAADGFKAEGTIYYYEWDLLAQQQLREVRIPVSADFLKVRVAHAALNHDASLALIANSSHEVILFDVKNGAVLKRFSGHRHATELAGFSQDEKQILAVSDRHQVWLWDIEGDPETPKQVLLGTSNILRATFVERDSQILTYDTKGMNLYSIDNGTRLSGASLQHETSNSMHRPESIVLSPKGDTFIGEANPPDGSGIALRHVKDGSTVWFYDMGKINPGSSGFPSLSNYATGFVFTPKAECLVVGAHGVYRVFNPTTGKLLFEERVNAAGYYLQVSPDGKYLIDTGSCDVTVRKLPAQCGGI